MGIVFLASLIGLPILGAAILILTRRSARLLSVTPAIPLSAVTTSILAGCCGFSRCSMPISPYETRGGFPWLDLVESMPVFIYVGFGIGALLASAVAIPAALINGLAKQGRSASPGDVAPAPPTPGDHAA